MPRRLALAKRSSRLRAAAVSDEDHAQFMGAVAGVAPIGCRDRLQLPPPPVRPSVPAPTAPAAVAVSLESAGDRVQLRRAGVSRAQVLELANGHVRPEATLDLHGCTVAVAEAQLATFMLASARNHRRCVLIVHGQGLHAGGVAVVRDAVIGALVGSLSGLVHAAATAMPKDGGPGSTYVMVKT